MNSPIASKSPGILKSPCRTDLSSSWKPDARDPIHDAASSFSRMAKKMVFLDVSTGKLVAPGYPRTPGDSGDSETEGSDEDWPHNLCTSSNCVLHIETVFSIVRPRYGRRPTDQMKDLDVNRAL